MASLVFCVFSPRIYRDKLFSVILCCSIGVSFSLLHIFKQLLYYFKLIYKGLQLVIVYLQTVTLLLQTVTLYLQLVLVYLAGEDLQPAPFNTSTWLSITYFDLAQYNTSTWLSITLRIFDPSPNNCTD